MADPRGEIAGVFDRASESYDRVGVDFFGDVGSALVDDVRIGDGDHVLDVGCGRGAVLFAAAEAVGPAGSVLGIDLAPGMVERTAAEAAERGMDNVRVEVQDAQEPTLPAAGFDVVLSSLVVFFLPDPLAALRAWRAATCDGGRLGLTTFAGRDEERWRWLEEIFPERDPRSTQPGQDEEQSPFASDDRLHDLLREAGYRESRSATREHVVTLTDPQHWLRWSWSTGMRHHWEKTPEELRPDVERRAVEHLRRMAAEPAGLTQRMLVRYTTAVAS